jgi:hypothetical protein
VVIGGAYCRFTPISSKAPKIDEMPLHLRALRSKRKTPLLCRGKSGAFLYSLIAILGVSAYGWQPGTPVLTLEDKVGFYSRALELSDEEIGEIVRLGPEMLPIIDKSLGEFISQPTSAEALRAHSRKETRAQDLATWNIVEGLIQLENLAVTNPKVTSQSKFQADDLVFAAFASPYRGISSGELAAIMEHTGSGDGDHLLRFLDDFDEEVRVAAARQLGKMGSPQTADKIEEILKRRAQGLSPGQIAQDRSLASGYAAIHTLRLKGVSSPSPIERPKPNPTQ